MEENDDIWTDEEMSTSASFLPVQSSFADLMRERCDEVDELATDPDAMLHIYCREEGINTPEQINDIVCFGEPKEQYEALLEVASPETKELLQNRQKEFQEYLQLVQKDEDLQKYASENGLDNKGLIKHIYEEKIPEETIKRISERNPELGEQTAKRISQATNADKPKQASHNVGKIADINDNEEPYQIWLKDFDRKQRVYDRIDIPRDSAIEEWFLSAIETPFTHLNKLAGQWRSFHLNEEIQNRAMRMQDYREQMSSENGPFARYKDAIKGGDEKAAEKAWKVLERDIFPNSSYLTATQRKEVENIAKKIDATLKDLPKIEMENKARAETIKKEIEKDVERMRHIYGGKHSATRTIPAKQKESVFTRFKSKQGRE